MKQITCYIDFVSPYAWLAFDQAPRTLEGVSYELRYKPVLLGALFKQYDNPGPAGIPPKREWTYRHATWLGHAQGCGLQMPMQHPFNPLPLARLALQCSDDGFINRFTADTIFRHVWLGGLDANDPARMEQLRQVLSEQIRPDSENEAKALLRANTEEASARGAFGVPSFDVDGKLFWGLDGLPMLRAYLGGDAWFDNGQWDAATQRPSGLG
ncbi:2-hydroxychromene-2-carboxylate isomerase [Diaphorobacter aerolatus]|uniref:2-hydroxychromene-2-carboxylate isomerase n=1 Tax=Diaphorobacter aerolatus TaxID=1288495 RepID=A0A7H0GHC7_9BURK|nr:2-hydroxychromene-2-carboxylate isomerase [Diaphorobacter aerolatus]QNP47693.1 2-hydroxychromene-2-carboxylate isomerase [Diaphorobacter aerolatus]